MVKYFRFRLTFHSFFEGGWEVGFIASFNFINMCGFIVLLIVFVLAYILIYLSALQIFTALSYIHRCIGVCHRDIKPQNPLVCLLKNLYVYFRYLTCVFFKLHCHCLCKDDTGKKCRLTTYSN